MSIESSNIFGGNSKPQDGISRGSHMITPDFFKQEEGEKQTPHTVAEQLINLVLKGEARSTYSKLALESGGIVDDTVKHMGDMHWRGMSKAMLAGLGLRYTKVNLFVYCMLSAIYKYKQVKLIEELSQSERMEYNKAVGILATIAENYRGEYVHEALEIRELYGRAFTSQNMCGLLKQLAPGSLNAFDGYPDKW